MKKVILTGCLAMSALFVSSVNAQTYAEVEKATDATPFSIETTLTENFGNGITWTTPALRGRYFVNENIGVRLQISLGDNLGSAMNTTTRFSENADGTGEEGTLEVDRMAAIFQVGAEYHFLGTQKLDPYSYIGINFGFGKQTTTGTDYNDGALGVPGTGYNADYNYEAMGGYSLIGGTIGLGMDFYFVENVYVGVELGVGITGYNFKDSERTDNFLLGGTPTENKFTALGGSESYLGTQGSLRLGWRF
ncbi:hypothetical protein ERX46_04420 [Brumimicrobium glaciale]|jgi:hypothetical protein|uniref:Outer membrane protein beta-barrel domain-containing protein n=1 Tax=Brumimicrobium glaciale TaxID=200475 RepID=A0A4Q4KPZ8_9FLAO|nr:hypothetical protein [Brumimicrobium glaciale]RYM34624.1 hypothetical protein ERX46_04420 [Brumimicrobium glaciale]